MYLDHFPSVQVSLGIGPHTRSSIDGILLVRPLHDQRFDMRGLGLADTVDTFDSLRLDIE